MQPPSFCRDIGLGEREEIEQLLRSKTRVEKRITRLNAELEDLRQLLDVMNRYLAEKSFKTGDAVAAEPQVTPSRQTAPAVEVEAEVPSPPEQVIPLKSTAGTLLCNLHVGKNELRIIPASGLKFRASTPPFQQFLINKVLNGMAAQDREDAVSGLISPDEILNYRVLQDGDEIKEVVVRNIRSDKRTATLRNSIRWTLEKMYEKMRL
ncbi:MAG: hypothetical protein ACE5PO_06675 [Candidatus Bathyarchaeia archaeon]